MDQQINFASMINAIDDWVIWFYSYDQNNLLLSKLILFLWSKQLIVEQINLTSIIKSIDMIWLAIRIESIDNGANSL